MSPMVRRGPELMEQREYEKPQPTRKRRENSEKIRVGGKRSDSVMAIAAHADAQALAQLCGPSAPAAKFDTHSVAQAASSSSSAASVTSDQAQLQSQLQTQATESTATGGQGGPLTTRETARS